MTFAPTKWMVTSKKYVSSYPCSFSACCYAMSAIHSRCGIALSRWCWTSVFQVSRLLLPPPGAHAAPTPVVALSFDTNQELLWVSNQYGRVTSFYGSELQRYTSFKAGDGPIHQLLFHEKGVIALGSRSIHMAMRRGPPMWHITYGSIVLNRPAEQSWHMWELDMTI